MIKLTETKDFNSVYWHDSILMSIDFDVLNNNILLYIDLCISNVKNDISYQPCLVSFNYASNFKMELEWNNALIQPEIAFIEKEPIDKPKHLVSKREIYKYTIHFLEPVHGKIELPMIAEFNIIMLSNPIQFEGDVDYYQKRLKVIKNYLTNYKK